MIGITVVTNTTRKFVSAETEATPAEVFDQAGIDVSRSTVNLDGTKLYAEDLDRTFEELGIHDTAQVRLSAIVKADGANF